MTMSQLMGLSETDIKHMSDKELEYAVMDAAAVVNKSAKNLANSGYVSDISKLPIEERRISSRVLDPSGLSTKVVKDRNDLIKELKRARDYYAYVDIYTGNYVKRARATVTGQREIQKNFEKRVGIKFATVEQYKNYWEAYNKLKELHTGEVYAASDQYQKDLASKFDGNLTVDELIERMDNRYEELETERKAEEEMKTRDAGTSKGPRLSINNNIDY